MTEYLKKASPKAAADAARVHDTVAGIIAEVRAQGLDAVRQYSRTFDGWDPPSFKVAQEEIERAKAAIAPDVLVVAGLRPRPDQGVRPVAARRALIDFEVETLPGVFLGQRQIPVANVGAYVPGGKYPMLMSAQMSMLTAKVAGVERVVACAPPYEGQGIFPEMLWSMALAGADEIWCLGGVQALALMACGAEGSSRSTSSRAPATCTWPRPNDSSSATWASTCWPARPRSSSSSTSRPTRASRRPICSVRPSTARPRRPCWSASPGDRLRQCSPRSSASWPSCPTREVAERSWADYGEVVVVSDREEAVGCGR